MFVTASSLIFLVIVGVWVVFFVQYWSRRSDHLATARTMDRFSESLRILERRTPGVGHGGAASQGRSAPVMHRLSEPNRDGMPRRWPMPEPAPSPARAPRPAPVAKVVPTRRARGVTFLLSVLLLADLAVFAAYGITSWWFVPMAFVAVVVAFGWVRKGVQATRRAREAGSGTRGAAGTSAGAPSGVSTGAFFGASAGAPAVVAPAAATGGRRTAAVRRGVPAAASEAVGAEARVESLVATAAEPTGEALFDIDAYAPPAPAAPATPARPLVDEDDMPLTWDPRPVPPPTYTMKATAQQPLPGPAGVQPEAIDVDLDDDIPAMRRVAGA